MALKLLNPTSPSLRGTVLVDRRRKTGIWPGRPIKSLVEGKPRTGGRNVYGRITVRHHGGGAKRKYRIVDFKRREKIGVWARVLRIEYDPNRTSFIALIEYEDGGSLSYIIAPHGLSIGDRIISDISTDVKPGNAMLLKNMPVGTIIHNIELKPEGGGQLIRAAGAYASVMRRDEEVALISLRSGEVRTVSSMCMATVGAVSNADHKNISLGKAGRSRWKGIRPTVRGVAMNPVDHPHGGGEGKTSGGRHPVTPWGKPTKGYKTRNNKRTDWAIVKRRKK